MHHLATTSFRPFEVGKLSDSYELRKRTCHRVRAVADNPCVRCNRVRIDNPFLTRSPLLTLFPCSSPLCQVDSYQDFTRLPKLNKVDDVLGEAYRQRHQR